MLKNRPDTIKAGQELCVSNPDSKNWFRGLELVGEGILRLGSTTAGDMEEWRRLIPVMVKFFQLARAILIQRDLFSDQASFDRMYSLGLALPLRFLTLFGDITAKWRLKCTLQAVRLVFNQKQTMVADITSSLQVLAPSQDVELDILRSVADLAKLIGKL